NARMSRIRRSAWRRPLRGGTTCSICSVNMIAPTRSLLRMADIASTAASSDATSLLKRRRVPKRSEPDTSTASITVSSRSSMYRLTYGRCMRAVTFQSMLRTSSPAWYSRTSANSIPCPLNTERYSPVKSELTSPRVRSSSSLTWRSTSGGTATFGCFATEVGRGCSSRWSGRARRLRRLNSANATDYLRAWRPAPHALHDLVARHLFGLGLVGGEHAMAEHVGRDRLHVVRRDEGTAAQKGVSTRRLGERDRSARARAELDQRREIGQPGLRRLARRQHDVDDVIHDAVVHVQLGDSVPSVEYLLRLRDGVDVDRLAARHAAHDLLLFIARRIADAQLEHEPVDLRFRKRVRAFLLDRVLRRQHEKGFFESERRPADRHLLLLHRFEQRRLHLGRRAVDLVGENDVGEDRS